MKSDIVRLEDPTAKDDNGINYPATVAEAVDELMKKVQKDDLRTLSMIEEETELYSFHHSLGQWIRNYFGLWRNNDILLIDTGKTHPDDASYIIIVELWKRCVSEYAKQES